VDSVWSVAFLVAVLSAAIPAGTAILYACLGELLAERAGVLNLGVEGMMLMGALGGVAVTIWTGTAWLGVVAAILAGCLMAGLHAVVTVGLRSNQVVSGLALTLLGGGLSAFLGRNLVGDPMPDKFTDWSIPLLGDIPKVGDILFDHDPLVYLSYIVAPVLWYWLFRTQPGLHLRAIGDNPAAADAMGVPVNWLRFLYVIVGGGFAGLGGAVISLGTNPGWTEGITAGRGWIAVRLEPGLGGRRRLPFRRGTGGPVPVADSRSRDFVVLPEYAAVCLHDRRACDRFRRLGEAENRRPGRTGPPLQPRGALVPWSAACHGCRRRM
jgi:ABC-type uncharacterized transport system permease subunit